MHRCEFCNDMFFPRVQVKRPRACGNCQLKRQRENEKAWRNRHKELSSAAYFRAWRKLRFERMRTLTQQLMEFLITGGRFHNQAIDTATASQVIEYGLMRLGIRRANKLYPA